MGKAATKSAEMRRQRGAARRLEVEEAVLRGELRHQPVLCCGMTAKGERCGARTRFPNRHCARHQKQTRFGRDQWLVEGAHDAHTNVSRPIGELVQAQGLRVTLPISTEICEARAGWLTLDDLHFLS